MKVATHRPRHVFLWRAGGLTLIAAAVLTACGGSDDDGGGREIALSVESSPSPQWVSGGDALVKVTGDVPAGASVRLSVNGTPANATFAADPVDGKPVALVTGLADGGNELVAELVEAGATSPSGRATLQLTNSPRNGPLFSGPYETPFVCQTDTFRIFADGPFLGVPLDANCSVTTRVDYVYRNNAGSFMALPSTSAVPADAASTTTSDGRTVPYIVRLETGTVNRAIYQTAVLHNPAAEADPSPTQRPSGWNGKLVYTFGGGCTGGWYRQGNSTGGVLDDPILRQGYAMASSSLNVFGNNCQDLTAAESMAMVKERFIEAYGRPRYTIGWGCSGGSYQQHQIADNYPGLLDGILPGCSFPEVMFATVYSITDMRLLGNYFTNTAPGAFTEEQQRQVAGILKLETMYTDTVYRGALRIAPDEYCPSVLPEGQRYNPTTNPTGARCSVYDHTVNVLGRDPATGFARRPLDNVGVQYGLQALNAGAITADQFLDLNERIGGYDVDARFQGPRTVADVEATRAAYQTGRLTSAGGGLRDVPIIDYRAYSDDNAIGDIHLRYHSFSMRERLVKANGDAGNQVMLVEDFRYGYYASSSPLLLKALAEMDKWIAAIQADTGSGTQHEKVVRNKPATLQEGCNTRDASPTFIAEPQHPTQGQCAQLYPVPPAPRAVAGAPLASDVVKCALKPVTATDYAVSFTAEQSQRLNAIFPTGVCDWSVPGVEQQGLRGTWLKF
ncbi:DUF6351 family protein [uncultured Azohydromonas sp.]|jgi:hypothetical protein|uniref:DUF6351 family protein n=1 Tax=uncultured Azohydromonas sp. TaxID=487342 RepID=UPI00262AC176|nr:DUF6351 family protein [uncultured Azohydromonas sp.]